MARKESLVFLGFEDEEIVADSETNSTTNKIGGKPDWPGTEPIDLPTCLLCGMKRPLILQLYAPLEQSHYHRTFYIFACLQPTCSQNEKSWSCVRVQHLDKKATQQQPSQTTKQQKPKKTNAKINWCDNLDDWGGEQASCDYVQMNATSCMVEEENGNDNTTIATTSHCRMDDSEEDESEENILMGNTLVNGLSQLNIKHGKAAYLKTVEPNANNCAAGLTLADVNERQTFAEIENEETDLVLAEAPIKPRTNLIELLTTPTTTTTTSLTGIQDFTLKAFFIAVDIEQPLEEYGNLSVEHIQEIYEKYKLQDDEAGGGDCAGAGGASGAVAAYEHAESYENSLPLHGDAMFHKFLSTIKMNPTQILRYTRDAAPILIEPLIDFDFKCQHCNGPTICEFQILPTLIPKLRLLATDEAAPIDFGNVLIFTCLKSCWETTTPEHARFEHVVVQKEK